MESRFSDTRRFGRFWLIRNNEKDIYSGVEKLGVEPLSAEFTAEYLQSRFDLHRRKVLSSKHIRRIFHSTYSGADILRHFAEMNAKAEIYRRTGSEVRDENKRQYQ